MVSPLLIQDLAWVAVNSAPSNVPSWVLGVAPAGRGDELQGAGAGVDLRAGGDQTRLGQRDEAPGLGQCRGLGVDTQ